MVKNCRRQHSQLTHV